MLKKIAQTLFVINEPIGRLTYFKYVMMVFACFLLFTYLGALVSPYLIYLLLSVLLVISFALCTKRAWDIFGLVLLFAKGQITGKKQSVDDNTQEDVENLEEG